MNGDANELLSHLKRACEGGFVGGGFVIAVSAPGPLIVKVLVVGLTALVMSWIVVWHLGYRRGRDAGEPRPRATDRPRP